MTEPSPPLRNITGRRRLGAFAAVLLLFAAALAVELFTLRRIAEAEAARLDHAKHIGHIAAAQVREQYIHQAHTLIEFGEGHLGHYAKAVEAARQTIAHLESVAEAPADKALARQIGELGARRVTSTGRLGQRIASRLLRACERRRSRVAYARAAMILSPTADSVPSVMPRCSVA